MFHVIRYVLQGTSVNTIRSLAKSVRGRVIVTFVCFLDRFDYGNPFRWNATLVRDSFASGVREKPPSLVRDIVVADVSRGRIVHRCHVLYSNVKSFDRIKPVTRTVLPQRRSNVVRAHFQRWIQNRFRCLHTETGATCCFLTVRFFQIEIDEKRALE